VSGIHAHQEERSVGANGCSCDFCTGRKRWDDNWCPLCALVQMKPPKWWENLDVCDACEEQQQLRLSEDAAR
jgi:hypothetical protein